MDLHRGDGLRWICTLDMAHLVVSTPYPHGPSLSYVCTTLGPSEIILHMIIQFHIF
jgi:hypothetical protein